MTREWDEEQRPKRRAHPKNTRRWCRGQTGVEHVTELMIPANAHRSTCDVEQEISTFDWEIGCAHVEACKTCGKHVRPFLKRGECPTRTPPTERGADGTP